jgi:hypothetical protein
MVWRVIESARAPQWTCAAASAVVADRILMLHLAAETKSPIAKTRKTRVTRTCLLLSL